VSGSTCGQRILCSIWMISNILQGFEKIPTAFESVHRSIFAILRFSDPLKVPRIAKVALSRIECRASPTSVHQSSNDPGGAYARI
jgi:hypothetical protein